MLLDAVVTYWADDCLFVQKLITRLFRMKQKKVELQFVEVHVPIFKGSGVVQAVVE